MSHSTISLGLGLGGGKSATSSGAPGGGGRAPFITNGKSVLFDGTNDHMKLASEVTFTGTYTFSIWLKPVSGNEGFICTGNAGSSGPWMDWYGAAYGNSLVVRNMGSPGSAGGSIVTGTWYNVLLIRDSSNVVKLYVDGSQAGSNSSFTGTAAFSWFGARATGGGSGAGGTFFNGHLDEIAFWDSDQTSNLAAIYNSGVAPDLWEISPPLHWYRMGDVNGGSGTTIEDIGSAANNTATLINGPTYSTDVPS